MESNFENRQNSNEKILNDFGEAKDHFELVEIIENLKAPIIGGDGTPYKKETLAEILRNVIAGRADLLELTRAEGLRNQAALCTIQLANNFEELKETLKHVDTFSATIGDYEGEEIRNMVNEAIEKRDVSELPVAFGLQATVKRLLNEL